MADNIDITGTNLDYYFLNTYDFNTMNISTNNLHVTDDVITIDNSLITYDNYTLNVSHDGTYSWESTYTIKDAETCIEIDDNKVEIKKDGVYINGKKETNPSKIGFVLLRMSDSLNENETLTNLEKL